MPYGHDLDFEACPPVYQPVSTLSHWINVRGFQRRNRYDIIKTVNRMRRKKFPVMTEADCQILLPRSIRYSSLEVMVPSVGSATWDHDNLSILRKVKFARTLKKFGKHNGVRRRAMKRVMNGHYFLDTLKSTEAESIATSRHPKRKLFVVSCDVLASQRKNIYKVYIVTNKDGEYIEAPFSRCTCAAGNLFCAHMLGLLCICRIAQIETTLDRIALDKMMPSHVLTDSGRLYPLRFFSPRD